VGASDTIFSSNLSSNSPLQLQAPAGTTRMYIDDATGDVGIGTTSPGSRLHIREDVNAAAELTVQNQDAGTGSSEGIQFNSEDGFGTSTGAGIRVFDNSNPSSPAHLSFFNNRPSGVMRFTVNGQNRLFIENGGNVGIGTSAPEQTLHVHKGSAGAVTANPFSVGIFENSASSYISILAPTASGKGILFGGPDDSVDGSIIYSGPSDAITFGTNGNFTRMVIESNGDVGIGTTAPTTKLQVVGDIRVGTAGTNGCVQRFDGVSIAGTCASDARLKKDIQPLSPLLDKLARLEPVTFNWRTEEYPELNLPKVKDQGLIAQEVEKILPELVITEESGFKAIHYHELPLMLLQAVKEQQKTIETLQAEVGDLKELVKKLLSSERKNVIQPASLEVGLQK
ncbi:MAG: tail fiber domain-containing protein, partial [Limisphaerales bacterium]